MVYIIIVGYYINHKWWILYHNNLVGGAISTLKNMNSSKDDIPYMKWQKCSKPPTSIGKCLICAYIYIYIYTCINIYLSIHMVLSTDLSLNILSLYMGMSQNSSVVRTNIAHPRVGCISYIPSVYRWWISHSPTWMQTNQITLFSQYYPILPRIVQ